MDASNKSPYNIPADAVWFITGCSSGIGQDLAQLVASKAPYRLAATARKVSSLAAIPESDKVLKLALDVTSKSSIDAAIEAALQKFGRIDVVVNNAGYTLNGDTENATDEEERQEIETLFWGPVQISKHAMRIMRDENPKTGQQGGVVLNVTSLGGFAGFPGAAFYHAGKFALEGFTESVAKEMRPDWNIHFCLIEPGGVQTNYATSSKIEIAPHPAYAAPDTPGRILAAYRDDPKAREKWARSEAVAVAMESIVSRGQRIPIRVPLGGDAWGMIKNEIQKVDKELDELKDLSQSVGHAEQLGSIDFLKNAD